MIRFKSQCKYTLLFEVVVDGIVKENDIIGALLTQSTTIHSDYNITKLQQNQKLGKIDIQLVSDSDKKLTRATVEIPSSMEKDETALFSAIIEQIKKVGFSSARFTLKEVIYTQEVSYQSILKRALQISNTLFSVGKQVDLKKAFRQMSSKKFTSLGKVTLGSSFYESSQVIVVEGQKDVEVLSDVKITNTIGVGGIHFDESQILDLLKGKELTLFLDGDSGGQAIANKLKQLLQVKYQIEIEKKKSVEDLTPSEIFSYLRTRKLIL